MTYRTRTKKQTKRIEVKITGITPERPSKHGGTYRYVFSDELDPGSLYKKMNNRDDWDAIVEALEKGYKFYTHSVKKKTRTGAEVVDCDYVPRIVAILDKQNNEINIEDVI
jgi:hypothetical protein